MPASVDRPTDRWGALRFDSGPDHTDPIAADCRCPSPTAKPPMDVPDTDSATFEMQTGAISTRLSYDALSRSVVLLF
jgi:hypothetical protein